MNIRQKKKLFKKKRGINPPKWLSYSDFTYHFITQKIWGRQTKCGTIEDFLRRFLKEIIRSKSFKILRRENNETDRR